MIAAIIRHGQIVIPRGITEFEVGDEVLAVVGPQAAEDLAALFARATPAIPPRRISSDGSSAGETIIVSGDGLTGSGICRPHCLRVQCPPLISHPSCPEACHERTARRQARSRQARTA